MTFTPTRLPIAFISRSDPAVVTTTVDHNLTTGQVVRVNVPKVYGMVELNKLQAQITVLTEDTFSLQYRQVPVAINVNSTDFAAFIQPSEPQFTAEILPMGSGPTPVTNTSWQVTNNFCDDLLGDAVTNIET